MRWKCFLPVLTLLLGAALPARANGQYLIRAERWSDADKRGVGEFITAIGDSGCDSVDSCLKGPATGASRRPFPSRYRFPCMRAGVSAGPAADPASLRA